MVVTSEFEEQVGRFIPPTLFCSCLGIIKGYQNHPNPNENHYMDIEVLSSSMSIPILNKAL